MIQYSSNLTYIHGERHPLPETKKLSEVVYTKVNHNLALSGQRYVKYVFDKNKHNPCSNKDLSLNISFHPITYIQPFTETSHSNYSNGHLLDRVGVGNLIEIRYLEKS